MTFRKHLRFLYEMFLSREARFPDEKFWSRDGSPAAMRKSSGPPKGTVGTTAKDYGVSDEPEAESDPWAGPNRPDLFDRFSKTLPEFQKAIMDAAKKLYGPNFEQVIDKAFGKPGLTQEAIRDLWDANATDNEALGEVGFLFDTAQGGGYSGGGVHNYPAVTKPGYFRRPKDDWDDASGSLTPRKSRPIGIKGGRLVF